MSGYWIQFIVFAVALLFFCWLLLEYWFYRKEQGLEKGLYLVSKAAFAFTHFWKAVDDAKEIPEDTLKEQAERFILGDSRAESRIIHVQEQKEKESRAMGQRKYFRRQM